MDAPDWSLQRDLIRLLVKRVEVDHDEINVVFRVAPPPASLPPGPEGGRSLQDCWRGADPLPRRDEKVHRVDPLVQRDMRPLHDGAGANREVFLALAAAVIAALARRDPIAQTANRAARAVRPEAVFQPQPTGFRVGNHLEKLVRGNGALAHAEPLDYAPIIARKSRGVKYIIPKFFMACCHFGVTARLLRGRALQARRAIEGCSTSFGYAPCLLRSRSLSALG